MKDRAKRRSLKDDAIRQKRSIVDTKMRQKCTQHTTLLSQNQGGLPRTGQCATGMPFFITSATVTNQLCFRTCEDCISARACSVPCIYQLKKKVDYYPSSGQFCYSAALIDIDIDSAPLCAVTSIKIKGESIIVIDPNKNFM